jgi:hypothetical protein
MKIMRSILAVAVMSMGVAAYPQNLQSWTVNIPFDFTVRHTNLQAGTYTVTQSGPIVQLTSLSGQAANVMTNHEVLAKPSNYSSLTFTVNDGQYDLAQIKNMGSSTELIAVVGKRTHPQVEASNAGQTVEVAAVGTR